MATYLSKKSNPELELFNRISQRLQKGAEQAEWLKIPETDDELWELTYRITGIKIPRQKVCEDHVAPFTAYSNAFFARDNIAVWLATRGFGGKSVLLAALGMTEAVILSAAVNLLGGSGEQSARVHAYMKGEDPNLPDKFWKWEEAPVSLLIGDHTKRETRLANHGMIRVLMASQASVRGPHPQRLRLDEIDEMDIDIFDAAMGQTMSARGIEAQTVASSTHQNAEGTMTEILERARTMGWPVYRWCYKETQTEWLDRSEVDRKKTEVRKGMWSTEYDLNRPSSEGLAITTEFVEKMFDPKIGEFDGEEGEYIRIGRPLKPKIGSDGSLLKPGASYIIGADWAKKRDWTIIVVLRVDVFPFQLVAFQRLGRRPWPKMIGRFNKIGAAWNNADGAHDATGLGDVIHDFLDDIDAVPIVLSGKIRETIINNYIVGVESGHIIAPKIEFAYNEHRRMKEADIKGSGHLPDTVTALAVAYHLARAGGWVLPMEG